MDLDLKVGDTILGGKFKNKKYVVASFSTDEHNQPIVLTDTGKKVKILAVRIAKLMKENKKITKNFLESYISEFVKEQMLSEAGGGRAIRRSPQERKADREKERKEIISQGAFKNWRELAKDKHGTRTWVNKFFKARHEAPYQICYFAEDKEFLVYWYGSFSKKTFKKFKDARLFAIKEVLKRS